MKNARQNVTRSVDCRLDFTRTLEEVRKSLKQENLQVLSELPFEERLEQATGLKWSRYTVLVVWSPVDAPNTVLSGTQAGLFLPFNIVVKEGAESTVVTALTHDIWDTPNQSVDFRMLLRELDAKIERVLGSINPPSESYSTPTLETQIPTASTVVASTGHAEWR